MESYLFADVEAAADTMVVELSLIHISEPTRRS